jgi:hypothetical protein
MKKTKAKNRASKLDGITLYYFDLDKLKAVLKSLSPSVA